MAKRVLFLTTINILSKVESQLRNSMTYSNRQVILGDYNKGKLEIATAKLWEVIDILKGIK